MNYWQPASVVAFLIVESFGSSQVSPQVEDVVWFGDNRGQKQHDWHYDLTYDDAGKKS